VAGINPSSINPSNFEAARAIVAKLADTDFQTLIHDNPAAAAKEFDTLLTDQGVTAPPDLPDLLAQANKKGAATYDKLLNALNTSPLSPADVENVMKLAPPPVFGIHCAKLA
jgi:hypothetical protein